MSRLSNYTRLMRLHRPIGIWLLLWPMLWSLWVASHGTPSTKLLIIFILGAIVMRSAGCVINDIADRNIDGLVARTRDRPLVTKQVTVKEAVGLFILLCLVAVILVLQLNWLTIKLSVVGLLLAMIYPFTKRILNWPQVVLGAAFAWAVIMIFAAVLNHVPAIAWLFYSVAVLWAVIYDTMYAMVDREDDRRIGVRSTALLFGKYDRVAIGLLQISMMVLLVVSGIWLRLNVYYYLGLFFALGFFVYQQYLIKDRIPQQCFRAFLNNHYFGAVVFFAFLIGLQ